MMPVINKRQNPDYYSGIAHSNYNTINYITISPVPRKCDSVIHV